MTFKFIRALVVAFFFFPSLSLTQESFRFEGLNKTKASYLRDLLQSDIAESADSPEAIENQLNLLKNSPGIANATIRLDTLDGNPIRTYEITERKTALPIVNFGGIRDNLWFSIGFIENNLRGRGEQLLAYYQNNNGRHSGQIYYKQPRFKNAKWGASLSLHKWASIEPLFFSQGTVSYLFDNNGVGASVIRNLTARKSVELRGTFFHEKYEKNSDQELENPPGPDDFELNKFLSDFSYLQNNLNYDFFYLKGFEVRGNLQNVFNFFDKTFFNSFQFQSLFFFRPSQKINIATRFKWAISTNNDSPFAPFVADSHVNIRGVGNRIDRGTAQAVLNVELRYTTHFKNYWGSQLVVFSDAGTWRNPGGELKELFYQDQFRHFVGLGARLIYQKVFGATLRVDYGIDVYNRNERGLVIGLGQYF